MFQLSKGDFLEPILELVVKILVRAFGKATPNAETGVADWVFLGLIVFIVVAVALLIIKSQRKQ